MSLHREKGRRNMSDNTEKALSEMLGNTDESTEEAKEETTEAPTSENTDKSNDEAAQPEDAGTDWKAESRKWESRAKENKEKADALDAATSRVSELEKQLTEIKGKADSAESNLIRWKVAAKYNVSEDDVNLFLTASDEETLVKQAQRLSQTSAHAPKPDAAQGTRAGNGSLSTADAFAAALEGQL
jgi:hypothetical protein